MEIRGIKHKPTTRRRKLIGWLALATLIIGLGVGLVGASAFPDACAMPVFYPLLLTRYAPLQSVLWSGLVVIVVLLLLLAIRRRLTSTTLAILVLVGAGLMLHLWADSQWLPQIVTIKTYEEEGIVHRLLYLSTEGLPLDEELSPVRAFVLLECGEWGRSLCHTAGIADMTLGGMGGFNTSDIDAAHLYYLYEDYADETNRTLMLQLGDGTTWEYLHTFIGCGRDEAKL